MPLTRDQIRDLARAAKWDAAQAAIAELEAQTTPQATADGEWLRGLIAQYQARYSEALGRASQALTIFREINDRLGEATSLQSVSAALRLLARYEEALSRGEEALTISREINDRLGEAASLRSVSHALRMLDRYEESLSRGEEAFTISRELNDRLGEAASLESVSAALGLLGRYEEALSRAEEALTISREINDRVREAASLESVSAALGMLGRYEEALSQAEEALTISREINDRLGEASSLRSVSHALRMLGRYEEALSRGEEALTISREIKERAGEATSLRSVSVALGMLDRYEEALSRAEEALTISREINDRLGEANALRLRGHFLMVSGRLKEAIEALRDAQNAYAEIGMSGFASVSGAVADEAHRKAEQQEIAREQAAVNEFFRKVDEQVGLLLQRVDRSDEQREAFLRLRRADPASALVFAREWNSWQPLVPGGGQTEARPLRGGGYLLRWAGKGIAIDPGPGFLDLLCEGGFGLRDIDAVLVTHNHIDHLADLPRVLTLVHEHNEIHHDEKRRLDLFLSPSVLHAYAGIAATSKDIGLVSRLLPEESVRPQGYALEIVPFEAEHEELGAGRHATSVAVKLLDPEAPDQCAGTVAFMSDTAWANDRVPRVVLAIPDLPRPLALVAHLGSVYETDPEKFHAAHLGYRGMAALIYHLKQSHCLPNMLVISEFGIESERLVAKIVTSLAGLVDEPHKVCDGTLGRTILLPAMDVACDHPRWGPGLCYKPSAKHRVADDSTHLVFRCREHDPEA